MSNDGPVTFSCDKHRVRLGSASNRVFLFARLEPAGAQAEQTYISLKDIRNTNKFLTFIAQHFKVFYPTGTTIKVAHEAILPTL